MVQGTITSAIDNDTNVFNMLTEMMEIAKAIRVDLAEIRKPLKHVVHPAPQPTTPTTVTVLLPLVSVEISVTIKPNLIILDQLSTFQAHRQVSFLYVSQGVVAIPRVLFGVSQAPFSLRPPPEPPPTGTTL